MSDLTGADPGLPAEDQPTGRDHSGHRRTEGPPAWLRTSALVVGGAGVLIVLFVVASAALPGWWAGTIGRQVDGVGSAGVLWGLFYGVLFTLLPLAVVFLAVRPNWHWKTRLIVGGVALLMTAPNLLTLAVAVGPSADTQAARTVMAIEAPNFRLATLIAVIVTLVVGAVAGFLIWRLVASRRELHKLRSQSLAEESSSARGTDGGKRRRGRAGRVVTSPDSGQADAAAVEDRKVSDRRPEPPGQGALADPVAPSTAADTATGRGTPAGPDMPGSRQTATGLDAANGHDGAGGRDTPHDP